MSKDKPNKSFRVNGQRPFKSYNPNISISNLQYPDPRRLEQIMSIPTAAMRLLQHRYGNQHQSQQYRHPISNHISHYSQQPYLSNFQQSRQHQHNFQDIEPISDSSNFIYDALDVVDSVPSGMRHEIMVSREPVILQGEPDPNLSGNPFHTPHQNFLLPNINTNSTLGNVSLINQETPPSMFNTSISFLNDCLTKSGNVSSTASGSGLRAPQFAQRPYHYTPTNAGRMNPSRMTLTTPGNARQYNIKPETDSENIHMVDIPAIQGNLLLQNQTIGNNPFTPSLMPVSTRVMSSCNTPVSITSHDLSPVSHCLLTTSNGLTIMSHDPVPASHVLTTRSHGSVPASHDLGTTAHDLAAMSHDLAVESHELGTTAHDLAVASHDLGTTSHDRGTTSHDLRTTSHDLAVASHDLGTTAQNTTTTSNTEEKSADEIRADPSYQERRRKNNSSAKRSRDARRNKEELIALRVVGLEEENMRLRAEIDLLDVELDELRMRLFHCN